MAELISEVLTNYIEEYSLFMEALSATLFISENQGGIETDGRGLRATRIFIKQTLTSMSLSTLFPVPTKSRPGGYLWDVYSIASLTRNLVEGYLALYYYGIETVSAEEADLRFQLQQLHKNIEMYSIRRSFVTPEDETGYVTITNKQKDIIRNHTFLPRLSPEQQKRTLRWSEMYKTKSDFEREIRICSGLKKDYRYLSNMAHALPVSFERNYHELRSQIIMKTVS